MAWLLLYIRRNMWLRAWFRWKAELRLLRRSEGIVRKKRKDELPRDCGRLIFLWGMGSGVESRIPRAESSFCGVLWLSYWYRQPVFLGNI